MSKPKMSEGRYLLTAISLAALLYLTLLAGLIKIVGPDFFLERPASRFTATGVPLPP
jgi:hypothetical protein